MGKSLKDALLDAGVKGTHTENERMKKREKEKTNTEKHQEMRDFCEACQRPQPDVEHYHHRNPLLDARWLCISCADKNMIHDKFRTTAQSEYAKKRIFRREYGETLKNPGDQPKFVDEKGQRKGGNW